MAREEDRFPSKFLKAEHLTAPDGRAMAKRVTIGTVTTTTFEDGKTQVVLAFKETDKLLGLNKTNWKAVKQILGKDDDSDWTGGKIEIYRGMTEFKGEHVACVRVRPVGGWEAAAAVVEEEAPVSEEESPDAFS